MNATKTLVVTSGALLRARTIEGSALVTLEVVEHGRKPQTWLVVPAAEVRQRAAEWAEARGVVA